MSKWLGYMVELYHDGQWFNIDQWHRHANGQLRHHFLYAAPERDILSSAHDELALSKERICFSDLAAETQDMLDKVTDIKGKHLWNEVIDEYREKKNLYLCRQDYNHPSFNVYVETVNQVFNKYFD